MKTRRPFSMVHAGFAGLLLAGLGCGGGDEIGSTLPVSGKVLVDRSSPPAGQVTFIPIESKGNPLKAAAVGRIAQGEYSLVTLSATGSKPGAPPGWYKVVVTTMFPPSANAPPAVRGPLVAARYATPTSTPLVVEVKEGGSYDLKVTSR